MTVDDQTIADARDALAYAEKIVERATRETIGPAVAIVALLDALCHVTVVMARAKGTDLDEVRAGLLGQVGRIFDMHRGNPP